MQKGRRLLNEIIEDNSNTFIKTEKIAWEVTKNFSGWSARGCGGEKIRKKCEGEKKPFLVPHTGNLLRNEIICELRSS